MYVCITKRPRMCSVVYRCYKGGLFFIISAFPGFKYLFKWQWLTDECRRVLFCSHNVTIEIALMKQLFCSII